VLVSSSQRLIEPVGHVLAIERKVSPDGFVQMAYQLAYYKLYKKTASTYEVRAP
jgi:hypothetical protein